ncbi:MAG: UDP-N-acetylglucosamine--N-acetylmuramyl-(pentapeptide) pyrophosphoryl-undecaprenol N-acetylglucosamine transferase [Verrucomicrobiae bacterium]|nr:UDP-N-acetylglucosamine--N-acetylmuramyl-(pentapeptide) pyrophosphoryl-undecaprenol N-acetylglucosamine transferase [Verrucomicrobiae bacterium]
MTAAVPKPMIAIACGGTGGHLFPGMTVGRELVRQGCDVTLLISPKEVDQLAVRHLTGMEVATLPALALQGRNYLRFLGALRQSIRSARRLFRRRRPVAVLGMGGFTAAAPMMAGRLCRAKLFLHESNAIPGRANRMLARWVHHAFVGFRQAADSLPAARITVSGTPVRDCFRSVVPETCRRVLELDPAKSTVLIMGGSQGARGVNRLAMAALPRLSARYPEVQYLWLAGMNDVEEVRAFCRSHNIAAKVRKFLPEMELAYGAATLAVSRSGAASLSEIAAMRVPSILIPLPGSADNHQFHNAENFRRTGAALLLDQEAATPEDLIGRITGLLDDTESRESMRGALNQWHRADAPSLIAGRILSELSLAPADSVREREFSADTRPATRELFAL